MKLLANKDVNHVNAFIATFQPNTKISGEFGQFNGNAIVVGGRSSGKTHLLKALHQSCDSVLIPNGASIAAIRLIVEGRLGCAILIDEAETMPFAYLKRLLVSFPGHAVVVTAFEHAAAGIAGTPVYTLQFADLVAA